MFKLKIPKIDISIQLLIILILTLLFGDYLSLPVKSTLYAISLTLKEILILILPFIIFSCLLNTMVSHQGEAFSFVLIVLIFVCISNFISILAGYGFSLILPLLNLSVTNQTVMPVLEPLWTFKTPEIFNNVQALILGLIFGALAIIFKWQSMRKFGRKANHWVTVFLKKIFVPLLPLFALGFIIKMQYEGVLGKIVQGYLPIIVVLLVANILYLSFMFAIVANFKFSRWLFYIKNVIPPGFLAFTTMSSLATMPLTLDAAEKNTRNAELSRSIIPATVNIHMIGDSLLIPIIAVAILLNFNHPMPTFAQFMMFTLFFMMAKFYIPGVPGGTIIVMLPILEKHLGFTAEMSAFILAVYILFDPIATTGNVLGNSALVIKLTNVMKRLMKQHKAHEPTPL